MSLLNQLHPVSVSLVNLQLKITLHNLKTVLHTFIQITLKVGNFFLSPNNTSDTSSTVFLTFIWPQNGIANRFKTSTSASSWGEGCWCVHTSSCGSWQHGGADGHSTWKTSGQGSTIWKKEKKKSLKPTLKFWNSQKLIIQLLGHHNIYFWG